MMRIVKSVNINPAQVKHNQLNLKTSQLTVYNC